MKKRVLIVAIAVLLILGVCPGALAANPSPGPSPSLPPTAVGGLAIDGTYLEDGMNRAYKDGYAPSVAGGVVNIVLPLTGSGDVTGLQGAGSAINCTLSLGGDASPFVTNNYDNIPVYPKFDTVPNFFVARFSLPLKADRVNGTYVVGIGVRYAAAGIESVQDFSVNVRVTDGKSAVESQSPGAPASQPKVIMSNYTVEPDPVFAGEAFTVTATLKNTGEKSGVRNITVGYKSQTTDLMPEDGASTSYISSIPAGGTEPFSFRMEARADAKPGPQKIDVAIAYEDEKANPYTVADEITVQVRQHTRLEYDEPRFPTPVYIGDSFTATLNLYNKGKNTLYNVTVDLEVSGVLPESSAFLGNMESGAAKTADVYGAVSPEDGMMGPVGGNFRVTYEDEYGDPGELLIPVQTELAEMMMPDPGMIDPSMEMPEETAKSFPWWGYAIIAGAGAAIAGGALASRKKKKRERELLKEMDEDEFS